MTDSTPKTPNQPPLAVEKKAALNPLVLAGPGDEPCYYVGEETAFLPRRYALVDKKHPFNPQQNGSLYELDKMPLGLRQPNPGFLYIIHSLEPKTLYRWQILEDGTLGQGQRLRLQEASFSPSDKICIHFPPKGNLKTLYLQHPLGIPQARFLLNSQEAQQTLMNQAQIDNLRSPTHTKGLQNLAYRSHCLEALLSPEDYPGPYFWATEAGWRDTNLIKATQVPKKFRSNYSYLLFNDVQSDIQELSAYKQLVSQGYQTSIEKKEQGQYSQVERYQIASVLQNLASRQSLLAQIDSVLQPKMQLPPQTQEQIKQFNQQMDHLIDLLGDPKNYKRVLHTRAKQEYINAKAEKAAQEITQDYLIDDKTLVYQTAEHYRQTQKKLIEGGPFGKDGINTLTNKASMDSFLEKWQTEADQFANQLAHCSQAMKALQPFWHQYAFYIDLNNPKACEDKIDTDNLYFNFFQYEEDDWLQSVYFSDNPGPLLSIFTPPALSEEFFAPPANYKDPGYLSNNLAAGLVALLKQKGAENGPSELEANLKHAKQIDLGFAQLKGPRFEKYKQSAENRARVYAHGQIKRANRQWANKNFAKPETLAKFKTRLQTAAQDLSQLKTGGQFYLNLSVAVNELQIVAPSQEALSQYKQGLSEFLNAKTQLINQEKQLAKDLKNKKISSKTLKEQQNRLAKLRKAMLTPYNRLAALSEASLPLKGAGESILSRFKPSELKNLVKELSQDWSKTTSVMSTSNRLASGLSVFLTFYFLNEFIQTFDDSEEMDAQKAFSLTTSLALSGASGLMLVNDYMQYSIAANLASSSSQSSKIMMGLLKYNPVLTTSTSYLGVYAMGTRTWNAGEDAWDAWHSDSRGMGYLATLRAIISGGGAVVGGFEARDLTRATLKFFNSYSRALATQTGRFGLSLEVTQQLGKNIAIRAAGMRIATIAASSFAINLALLLVFIAIDWIWQYYQDPPLVQWAQKSLWGNEPADWTFDQHLEHLDIAIHGEKAKRNNQAKAQLMPAQAEQPAKIRLYLPRIMQPTQDNLQWTLEAAQLKEPTGVFSFLQTASPYPQATDWQPIKDLSELPIFYTPLDQACLIEIYLPESLANRPAESFRLALSVTPSDKKEDAYQYVWPNLEEEKTLPRYQQAIEGQTSTNTYRVDPQYQAWLEQLRQFEAALIPQLKPWNPDNALPFLT